MDLSIVIPARNEQGNIEPLVAEIRQAIPGNYCYEIIYIDDGSTDNTKTEIEAVQARGDVPIRLLRHRNSAGQSSALYSGISQAKGKWIVSMDADGQNDPADIPAMLQCASTQTAAHFCIAGFRHTRRDTFSKRIQSRVANGIRQRLLNDQVPDTGCGIKLFPRNTFMMLPFFDHMHRFIPALVRRIGGSITVVPVNHRERVIGTSKYTLLSRLGVGIVDMLGVLWLQRRCPRPEIMLHTDES